MFNLYFQRGVELDVVLSHLPPPGSAFGAGGPSLTGYPMAAMRVVKELRFDLLCEEIVSGLEVVTELATRVQRRIVFRALHRGLGTPRRSGGVHPSPLRSTGTSIVSPAHFSRSAFLPT